MGCDVPSISFALLPGTPVSPSSGRIKLYVLSSDQQFKVVDSSGTVSPFLSYLSPVLNSIQALSPIPADQIIYTNGVNSFNESPITLLARQLLDDPNQATMQSTLGLVIGTNVQAHSPDLDSFVTNAVWAGANLTLGGNLTTVGNVVSGGSIGGTSGTFTANVQMDSDLNVDGATTLAGLTIGGAGGPTLTTGSGVPAAAESDGSIYLRTGAPNGSLYVRENGAWVLK